MLQEGLLSTSHCLSILKACHSAKALHRVHHLHARIVSHGILVSGLLGDYLVVTYAKCGALDEACLISSTLPCRTVFSWSAIISGYADSGRSLAALQLHRRMADEGIEPNDYTFVSLLKACGNASNLEQGRKFHANACFKGFTSDRFVANTLISMYGKCGKTKEAEDVFQALSQCDVVSWTAMISAYVEVGLVDEAFLAYRQMREENVKPNRPTFVTLVQACCCLADGGETSEVSVISPTDMSLEIGEACHVDAERMGFISDEVLLNTLATMYSKCCAITQAEDVLGSLCHPHIVSWNAMLSAYVQQGEAKSALLLYRKMHNEGINPELHTVVFVLQACNILVCNDDNLVDEGCSGMDFAADLGLCLHEDACRMGWAGDVFVGTALLSMYGKVGRVSIAEHVFAAMSHHDLPSCNAMLTMYAEQGEGNLALRLYREMCGEGLSPNQLTFVACLQGCVYLEEEEGVGQEMAPMKAMSLEIVKALHSDCLSKGYALDPLVANTLISVYGKLGAVREVEYVFIALLQRTVVSWTAVISILAENNQGHKALQLFRQMQEEYTHPNELTYVAGFQACTSLSDAVEDCNFFRAKALEIGHALHIDVLRVGFMLNLLVNSALLSMYGRCGSLFEAESVFTLLPCFNVETFNAMISLCIVHGEGEKAICLYGIMQQERVPFNQTTFIYMLEACSESVYLQACYELHFNILVANLDWILSVNSSLVNAYGRSASMVDAHDTFNKHPMPHVSSWIQCIAGYAGTGNPIESLRMHENLKLTGYLSDFLVLSLVLSACSRAGLVSDGTEHFINMREEKGSVLDVKYLCILLDLFGRAGDFTRVNDILMHAPMQPDLAALSSVLAVCRLHSQIELAEHVFELIMHSHHQRAAPYVLMLNMYANAQLQHHADIV